MMAYWIVKELASLWAGLDVTVEEASRNWMLYARPRSLSPMAVVSIVFRNHVS
jgi:hypothetical protein